MLDYQERVIEEEKQLAEKIFKLESFLKVKLFAELDSLERRRLRRQLTHMEGYLRVLQERIEAFYA